MSFPKLPSFDAAEAIALSRDGKVTRAARLLRRDLSQAISVLEPATLVAVARQSYPDTPDLDALALMAADATTVLRALADHGVAARGALTAELARLQPLIDGAGRRSAEIRMLLSLIEPALTSHATRMQKRRAELKAADVTGDDLERLAPLALPANQVAERDALLAEQLALEQFVQTRDERHLPKGFKVRPPLRVESTYLTPPPATAAFAA